MATASGMRASTVRDGDVSVPSGSSTATLYSCQTVSSPGHETVSDSSSKAVVKYYPGKATIGPFGYDESNSNTKKGIVYVPIHNPPVITTQLTLSNILIKFDVLSDATVDTVTLYYDNKEMVETSGLSKKKTFHIDFDNKEASTYAYVPPKGVSVMLDLRFPNLDSSINLYSVTLVYKATSS